jgi:hypothetical protein
VHKSVRQAALLFVLALLALAGCARALVPPVDVRAEAIEQRKDALLRQLADCEAGAGEGPITGGGGRYIGRFQFMPATVINYVRQRDGRLLGPPEAIALANDYRQAAELAKYVIFERDGLSNWPACSRKLGLARQVAEIRAL